MKQPLVKVCGMTQLEQVQQLKALGADYMGFIFYPSSPRYVVGKIEPAALRQLDGIEKVGVFVNAAPDEIQEKVKQYGLTAVQLHGDETPEFIASLELPIPIIKVFRVAGDEDLQVLTKPYAAIADFFLFDTKAKEYGGTGKKFDWSFLENVQLDRDWFLSGGIGPDDVAGVKHLLGQTSVHALDLNSRFEMEPGVKDLEKLGRFLKELKAK